MAPPALGLVLVIASVLSANAQSTSRYCAGPSTGPSSVCTSFSLEVGLQFHRPNNATLNDSPCLFGQTSVDHWPNNRCPTRSCEEGGPFEYVCACISEEAAQAFHVDNRNLLLTLSIVFVVITVILFCVCICTCASGKFIAFDSSFTDGDGIGLTSPALCSCCACMMFLLVTVLLFVFYSIYDMNQYARMCG